MSRRSIRRVVSSLQAVRMFCVTETHAPTIADIDGRVNGEWENVRYCRNWEEMSVGSDFHGVRSCMTQAEQGLVGVLDISIITACPQSYAC
jgi:hypothetical protein